MAKKKTGKVIQMLSPENYIRKKVRLLPIYKCLVNSDWEDGGFANLIVSRGHTNGNLSLCFYLVDLYCLGVKDTHFRFNITRSDFQELIEKGGNDGFIEISYPLAHNIVYAGLEFAEEYGFKAHKDFNSITRFMLEEDTEDVELIDIECGRDDKPFFVSGPFDDQVKINKILAQLEKTAGPGNYDYLLDGEDEPDKNGFDEDDEYIDELEGLSMEEIRDMFLNLKAHQETLNEEDTYRLENVTDWLFEKMTDPELVDKYYEEYLEELDIELTSELIPDEMLGITAGTIQISPESRDLFMKIFVDNADNPKQAHKLLEKFRNLTPDIPASYYLELQILREEDSPQFSQKLEEYYARFPDYSLIKINWLGELFLSEVLPKEYLDQTFSIQSIFPGRRKIHSLEMFNFLMFKLTECMQKYEANRLEGFCWAYEELNLSASDWDILDGLVSIIKSRIVAVNFSNRNK